MRSCKMPRHASLTKKYINIISFYSKKAVRVVYHVGRKFVFLAKKIYVPPTSFFVTLKYYPRLYQNLKIEHIMRPQNKSDVNYMVFQLSIFYAEL